jgi:hypothetical protein
MNMETALTKAQDIIKDFNSDGVHRQTLLVISKQEIKVNLRVALVTAINNKEGAPNYDENVPFISGSDFEVKLNGTTRRCDVSSDVQRVAENMIAQHLVDSSK